MILHPGILALIVGSSIVLLMMMYGSFVGMRVWLRWDFSSSSEEQLVLERKTFLVSSIVRYALAFEVFSVLLFIYTIDDIHQLFMGAMCATGSLNANPIGWVALFVKMGILLLAPVWVVLDIFDQKAGDYPLIRAKYVLLQLLTLVVALDLTLVIRYFAGLRPEIITSCCGALFSESGPGVAGEMAALPAAGMMWLFYVTVVFFLATLIFCLLHRAAASRYALALLAVMLFFVSIASVISTFSMYIYQLPTHHCPFDMFQGNYSYVAYPIFLGLFSAVFFGFLPGIFQPLKKVASLEKHISEAEKKWLVTSAVATLLFVTVVSWPVVFGGVEMMGY